MGKEKFWREEKFPVSILYNPKTMLHAREVIGDDQELIATV